MNRYYIFFDSLDKIADYSFDKFGFALEGCCKVELSEKDLKRLLGDVYSESLLNKNLYMAVLINEQIVHPKSFFFKNVLIQDGCEALKKCIETFNGYGNPSIKANKIIQALLEYDIFENNCVCTIRGSKGWSSLREFFHALKNADIKYVVLRKYDLMPDSFIEDDKDLDVLCISHDEFVLFANAEKRSIGISGYKIKVENDWLSLDVRFVGDDYYEKSWQRNVLANRIEFNDCVYVMDHENYLYTVAYHVLTQKQSISSYYKNLILTLEDELYGSRDLLSSEDCLAEALSSFMKANGYLFVEPKDNSVIQNQNNIKKLKTISYYPSDRKLKWIEFATRLRRCPKRLYDKVNTMK